MTETTPMRCTSCGAVNLRCDPFCTAPQKPATTPAAHALAERIAAAVVEDEKPENGGCDVSAGLFGPRLSALVRELAAGEQTLAGLVKRLARRLSPGDPLRVAATQYLQEHGLFNPLRANGVRACGVTLPVEPTMELLQALVTAADLEQSDPEDPRYDDGTEAARTIYKALLNAAPGVPGMDKPVTGESNG